MATRRTKAAITSAPVEDARSVAQELLAIQDGSLEDAIALAEDAPDGLRDDIINELDAIATDPTPPVGGPFGHTVTNADLAAMQKANDPKPAKRDKTRCHWGGGSYGSPDDAPKCTRPLVPGKQLCTKCEAKWSVVSKARAAAKKTTRPSGVAKPAAKPAKNSGGVKHEVVPPTKFHAVPVARVNAPVEYAAGIVSLIS